MRDLSATNFKRIILITTSFPDNQLQEGQEAAGSFVADFAEELARYVRLTIVAPGSDTGSQKLENFSIRRFAVPSLPLSLLKANDPRSWKKILISLRSGHRAVQRAVFDISPNHIFAFWTLPSGYWALRQSKRFNIPYSVWALGSDVWTLGKIPVISLLLKFVLKNSHRCFADGYLLVKDVQKISGKKCFFLPSVRKFSFGSKKKMKTCPPYNFAFLGRWHPHKGVDLLLESLSQLRGQHWRQISAIKIYGGGPLSDIVYSRVAALKAEGRPINAGGYLDRSSASRLLAWADYLLLPSRIESIPVIFSDAMQSNCPIVSTPIGDIPRLLQTYNLGILSKSVSPGSFSIAIRKAIQHAPIEYSKGIQKVKRQFHISHSVDLFLNSID